MSESRNSPERESADSQSVPNENAGQTTSPESIAFYAAYYSAVTAVAFSALTAVLLLASLLQRVGKDPLDSPAYQALLQQLAEDPQNETLKAQIREEDLRLRKEYFAQRRFVAWGGMLLAAGLVIAVAAGKLASVLRRPMPQPEGELPSIPPSEGASPRFAVLITAVVLAAVCAYLGMVYAQNPVWEAIALAERGTLPGESPEAGEGTADAAHAPETTDGETVPANIPDPNDPSFPADEEYFAQWPRFRGPDGSGCSPHPNAPVEWDATSGKNVIWKVPVPLPGNSSPIVWGDRVFVTGADESRREVYCFDAASGKLLWASELTGTPESTSEPPEVMEDTGFAAPTPVTDGRRVFAIFANGDVGAFDYAGNVLWSHSLGIPDNAYGHASSLALYHDLVIVQFDQGAPDDDKSRLIAYKAATGEVGWEITRPVANSWTTPLVVFDHDPPMIVTCADPYVTAYNAQDGSELWRLEGTTGDCGPSAVFSDGVVYVGNEYSYLFAIPTDKSGELTEDDALWIGEEGLPDLCSPLVVGDMVLVVAYGALTAYDAAGGEVLWTFEFDDADFSSSPSLAEGRLYLFDKEGKCFVLEADREGAKIVSEPVLGEPCVTSPAFQPGRLYIRGAEHLYCIGESDG